MFIKQNRNETINKTKDAMISIRNRGRYPFVRPQLRRSNNDTYYRGRSLHGPLYPSAALEFLGLKAFDPASHSLPSNLELLALSLYFISCLQSSTSLTPNCDTKKTQNITVTVDDKTVDYSSTPFHPSECRIIPKAD